MRFARIKHVGRGVFRMKHLPRCKCPQPDGKANGVCKSCGLAVLNPIEKEDYRRAYPTTARMIDGERWRVVDDNGTVIAENFATDAQAWQWADHSERDLYDAAVHDRISNAIRKW